MKLIKLFLVVSVVWCAPFTANQATHRPLKILVVMDRLPGIDRTFIMNQITGLIDQGHDVYCYSEGFKMPAPEHPQIAKYRIAQKTFVKQFPTAIPLFDIILCQFGDVALRFLPVKAKYKLSGKLVVCFRGFDISAYLQAHPDCYRELFSRADLFLPICEKFRKSLISNGCDPRKIVVHHSGIDCEKFSYEPRDPSGQTIHLISINRLVEKKGTEYAIKAVAALVKKYPQIQYDIIGDGGLKDSLLNIINSLGISKNVSLLGWRDNDEVAERLKKAHIFILPSIVAANGDQEGIPNALKEAMASGLPVVSTYHSGIEELVFDGQTGFLVAERDVITLADRLEFLIVHTEVWNAMGRKGREIVEQAFDTTNLNERLENLFFSLLGKGA